MTRQLQRLAAEVLAPGVGIDTVVNTHGNGDHSYGNELFRAPEPEAQPAAGARTPGAEIISTEANGVHLCAEPSPADLARLIAASDTSTPLGAYITRHFGRYGDFGGVRTVHPTRTFSGELTLDVGGVAVRLIEVGPAHTAGDLIVHLPDDGIVCAGDVVFNEDHPVHWAGPLAEVHRACTRILECEPRVVVPGHGPLMTPAEVRTYADYLLELRDRIHQGHAAGRPLPEVAAALVAENPYPALGLPERMAILAAVEYRTLDGDEAAPNLVQLVGFAAGFATL
jgi:glyoxylase-like metal-dependent hydrolase (beta-lactamase superfamily II)